MASAAMDVSVARAGTCHAPHTTATRSKLSFTAARTFWRMDASRCASRPLTGLPPRECSLERPPGPLTGSSSRRAPIASAMASNGPVAVCSTMSSHHRSTSAYPAAEARSARGSRWRGRSGSSSGFARRRGASQMAAGRSMKRTGTSWASPWRMARHSGEKAADGQKKARRGLSTTWTSRATGGRISSDAARPISSSASGGPSISRTSGRHSSSATSRLRAEPGPWWRMPKYRTATRPAQLSSRQER